MHVSSTHPTSTCPGPAPMPMPQRPVTVRRGPPTHSDSIERLAEEQIGVWRCSGASLPPPWHKSADVTGQFATFSGGDRFTVTRHRLAGQRVAVCQGVPEHGDPSALLVEQLQAVWAARAAGADDRICAVLPQALDPQLHQSPLIRLTARLAEASGVRQRLYFGDVPAALPNSVPAQAFLQQVWASLHKARLSEQAGAVADLAARQARLCAGGLKQAWIALGAQAAETALRLPKADASQGWVVFGLPSAALATAVAHELHRKGNIDVEVGRYTCDAGGNMSVQTDLAGKRVAIVQGTRPEPAFGLASPYDGVPQVAVSALLLQQAAEEAGAAHIAVVQAYQMNGRADREEHSLDQCEHVGAYASAVASWHLSLRMDKAVLLDPHDLHTVNAWSPAHRPHAQVLDAMQAMVHTALEELRDTPKAHRILALPDAGSNKRTREIQQLFKNGRVVVGDKTRVGHGTSAVLRSLHDGRDFGPKDVVILPDDEISGGATMVQAISRLAEQGAQTIHVLLVHNNLPLDPVQRQLRLGWLRWCGATSLRFTDSQPMGHVVRSFAELCHLHGERAKRAVEEFLEAKRIDTAPEQFFAGLAGAVQVTSAAPQIAEALAPGAATDYHTFPTAS